MIARLPGIKSAPPCAALAAIRAAVFGANPQATGGCREDGDTEREHAPPAKAIAGRADQDQRAEHQHVGVGDPLSPFDGRGQIRLDGWQGNSDH